MEAAAKLWDKAHGYIFISAGESGDLLKIPTTQKQGQHCRETIKRP